MKNTILKLVAGMAKKSVDANRVKHSLSYLYQPKMPQQLLKDEK